MTGTTAVGGLPEAIARRTSTLFLDVDGTLVDSNAAHVEAWLRVFGEAGFRFDPAVIHARIGQGGDMLVPSLLPQIGAEAQHALAEAHGRLFKAAYMPDVRPLPGVPAALARLRAAGLGLVLASSSGAEEVDHYLDVLDLRGRVACTTSKDDAGHSKPAPDIFAAALAKSGRAPDEVLVVGDTPYDIIAARRCGITAVGVLSGGFAAADLLAEGATAVLPGLPALAAALGQRGG